ncbi:MAG: outer membrane lipid asymmetry maintenance protein MlaD [Holosporales bacterium]|jgi:phospholipid/cholesterol/gamma-HCH transport system substrate-binding protein|nr:outer membrane lipid asymmetry maintenance protein MlaD [Holosporales bacterium]
MDRFLETFVGLLVLVVAGGFFHFAYTYSAREASSGYILSASFDQIGGINLGSDVKIGGVKIGTVSKITLAPETYLVAVEMQIDRKIQIPRDTTAAIVSEGLIGGKFISFTPGGDDVMLKDREALVHTQGAINIEAFIGKMMFSSETK